MDEDDKKEGEKSESSAIKDKSDGDRTSEMKDPSEQDGMELVSPKPGSQLGSSEAGSEEVFSGEPDPTKHELQEEGEHDDEMVLRRLRCLTSSFLAGVRCSLHCKN